MKAATSAQLVTVCQPLATSESESGHNRLTFMPLCGQILDGHEWSMAGRDRGQSSRPDEQRGI
jgi:hypothetical protein